MVYNLSAYDRYIQITLPEAHFHNPHEDCETCEGTGEISEFKLYKGVWKNVYHDCPDCIEEPDYEED